jgi:NDP-sugar pyrophosphorylase family protein
MRLESRTAPCARFTLIREAVVLAAGLGLRMRPITLDWPKPALPLLNRPLLHWTLDGLRAAGVDRVLVNLHHLPDRVRAAAQSAGGGMEFVFSFEPEILGTAGLFGPLGESIRGEVFLAANGDVLHGFPVTRLEEELYAHPDALAVLALRRGSPRYTPVALDSEGRIAAFGSGDHMFAGVYVARKELLRHLRKQGPAELVPDLLVPLLPGGAVRGLVFDDPWEDLGDASGFLRASLRRVIAAAEGRASVPNGSRLSAISGHPVLMGPDARVETGAWITGPAVLGGGVHVVEGVRVGRSVLLPGVRPQPGQVLESAIASPSGILPVQDAPGPESPC